MPQSPTPRKGQTPARGKQAAQPVAKAAVAEPVSDKVYGLVSVLYHALQGAETYGKYATDAEEAGDTELVEFFEQCRDEESERAKRAKQLLVDRAKGDDEDEEDDDDDDDDDDEEEDEDEEDEE
jgi:hypothetical protein